MSPPPAAVPIVKAGLPVRPETAGDLLPYLRIVRAHAPATDRLALVVALDHVLTDLIHEWDDPVERRALRALAGLTPGGRSKNLTERQADAATILGRNPEHVAKRVQPQLMTALAYELARRDYRYRPRLTAALPAQRLPAPELPMEDDDLLQLELQDRIGAALHATRAELLAVRRLAGNPTVVGEHLAIGLWQMAQLLELTHTYTETYGPTMRISGEERLIGHLAGVVAWRGPFTAAEVALLRAVVGEQPDLTDFSEAFAQEPALAPVRAKWEEWATASADRQEATDTDS